MCCVRACVCSLSPSLPSFLSLSLSLSLSPSLARTRDQHFVVSCVSLVAATATHPNLPHCLWQTLGDLPEDGSNPIVRESEATEEVCGAMSRSHVNGAAMGVLVLGSSRGEEYVHTHTHAHTHTLSRATDGH